MKKSTIILMLLIWKAQRIKKIVKLCEIWIHNECYWKAVMSTGRYRQGASSCKWNIILKNVSVVCWLYAVGMIGKTTAIY